VQVVTWFALVQVKSRCEKILALWGLRGGETSRLGSMDPVAKRDQVRAAWWQEMQDEVVDMSWCMEWLTTRVCTRSLSRFTTKPPGSLVEPHSQDRRLDGRRWDLDLPRSFEAGDTWQDRGACVERTGLQRRRGRPMRILATWPNYPWGVCIFL
jgi:hypothetical protein